MFHLEVLPAPTAEKFAERATKVRNVSLVSSEKSVPVAENFHWEIEVLYDGACPLCLREIQMLRWLDRQQQKIRFTDIADPEFQAEEYGRDWNTLMARIHGRLPNGTLLEGVEVFRRLYAAVGLGWLMPITRWWGIRHLLDALYVLFARYRLVLTGRHQQPVKHCQTDRCAKSD